MESANPLFTAAKPKPHSSTVGTNTYNKNFFQRREHSFTRKYRSPTSMLLSHLVKMPQYRVQLQPAKQPH